MRRRLFSLVSLLSLLLCAGTAVLWVRSPDGKCFYFTASRPYPVSNPDFTGFPLWASQRYLAWNRYTFQIGKIFVPQQMAKDAGMGNNDMG